MTYTCVQWSLFLDITASYPHFCYSRSRQIFVHIRHMLFFPQKISFFQSLGSPHLFLVMFPSELPVTIADIYWVLSMGQTSWNTQKLCNMAKVIWLIRAEPRCNPRGTAQIWIGCRFWFCRSGGGWVLRACISSKLPGGTYITASIVHTPHGRA